MLQYKQKSLISDTAANKELNVAVDKAVDTHKEYKTVPDKELNTIVDETVNSDKKQDHVARK